MSRLIFHLVLLASGIDRAIAGVDFEPIKLSCRSELGVRILQNDGVEKVGEPRFTIDPQDVGAIEFHDKKKVAKLFPIHGLHGRVFDAKGWLIETDERTYWELVAIKPILRVVVSCRVGI